jgi:hypothetical protein
VSIRVYDHYIFELYVEILVDRQQYASDYDVVLQFNRYFLANKGLEKGKEDHFVLSGCTTAEQILYSEKNCLRCKA